MRAIRLFFALWLPEELRDGLWRSLAPLRRARTGVRWVPPERFHITLRFMGDTSRAAVSRLTGAADTLASHTPFPVHFTRTGVFPSRGAPRVHWVGVTAAPVVQLRGLLDTALAREGIAPGSRAFKPHLTVGRVRPGRAPRETDRRALNGAGSRLKIDGFTVDAVHLVRSELFPGGPRYANIHTVALTGHRE